MQQTQLVEKKQPLGVSIAALWFFLTALCGGVLVLGIFAMHLIFGGYSVVKSFAYTVELLTVPGAIVIIPLTIISIIVGVGLLEGKNLEKNTAVVIGFAMPVIVAIQNEISLKLIVVGGVFLLLALYLLRSKNAKSFFATTIQ
jgi:hypothetical protein